jgi:hypothetical protein
MCSSIQPHVKIIVWPGSSSIGFSRSGIDLSKYSPGHVALETHDAEGNIKYISLWPDNCPWRECPRGTRSHFHSYKEDQQAEQSQKGGIVLPSVSTLYLDIEKINAAAKKFEQAPYKWTVLGSSIFRQAYERNCSGLALFLLERGGLRTIIPHTRTLSGSRNLLTLTMIIANFSLLIFFTARPIKKMWDLKKNYEGKVAQFERFKILHILNPILTSPDFDLDSKIAQIPKCIDESLNDTVKGVSCNCLKSRFSTNNLHLGIAIASTIAPFAFAIFLGIMNQKIFLKTITPRDVKELAAKAEKIQSNGLIEKSQKRKSLFLESLLIGAVFGGSLVVSKIILNFHNNQRTST